MKIIKPNYKSIIFFIVLLIFSLEGKATSWTGSIDGDWHKRGNWDTGVIPTKFDIVNIPGTISYTITISSQATCKKLILGGGVSRLHITSTGTLTIGGIGADGTDLFSIPNGSKHSK